MMMRNSGMHRAVRPACRAWTYLSVMQRLSAANRLCIQLNSFIEMVQQSAVGCHRVEFQSRTGNHHRHETCDEPGSTISSHCLPNCHMSENAITWYASFAEHCCHVPHGTKAVFPLIRQLRHAIPPENISVSHPRWHFTSIFLRCGNVRAT